MTARGQLALADWTPRAPLPPTPADERDRVLARHEEHRAAAVAAARAVAARMPYRVHRGGAYGVTVADVVERLRAESPAVLANLVGDTRWSGAVILPSLGWRKTGETPEGHHARKVPVWQRDGDVPP